MIGAERPFVAVADVLFEDHDRRGVPEGLPDLLLGEGPVDPDPDDAGPDAAFAEQVGRHRGLVGDRSHSGQEHLGILRPIAPEHPAVVAAEELRKIADSSRTMTSRDPSRACSSF